MAEVQLWRKSAHTKVPATRPWHRGSKGYRPLAKHHTPGGAEHDPGENEQSLPDIVLSAPVLELA